jgi:hypothetical protein
LASRYRDRWLHGACCGAGRASATYASVGGGRGGGASLCRSRGGARLLEPASAAAAARATFWGKAVLTTRMELPRRHAASLSGNRLAPLTSRATDDRRGARRADS